MSRARNSKTQLWARNKDWDCHASKHGQWQSKKCDMSPAVDAPLRLCASKQKQRQQQTLVLGGSGYRRTETGYEKKHALVPDLSTREENWEQANKWNWQRGQSTYEQEPRTCWSKRTRIGLESDAASKCDGNRSCDVLYGTALFLSATHGHLYARRKERERERAEGTV